MQSNRNFWTGRAAGCRPTPLSALWSLGICLVGWPALAVGQTPAAAGPGANVNDPLKAEVISEKGGLRRLRVTVDQSLLVGTNKPTVRVQAINPQIAFIQSVSPKQLLISGVSYGTTQVILWADDDEQEILEVEVGLDLEGLKKALADLDPTSQIQATSVRGSILLTGTVSHVNALQRVEEIAALFLPEGGSIKNQLRIADDVLSHALKSADPQGQVQAQNIGGNLVLTGSASGARAAEKLVQVASMFAAPGAAPDGAPGGAQGQAPPAGSVTSHLLVPGEQQVMLRCVVAEVSRDATRELGVNGFLAGENFRDAFVVNQIGGIASLNMGVPEAAPVTANMPFLVGEDGIPIPPTNTLSLGFPRVQMQLFLKAMADNSLLRILAEPNLVAVSGETAGFLAGGEFPIPVPQGVDQITIEYKQFGVGLNFTPVVLDDGLIRMRINPEVSELDFTSGVQLQGFSVPGVSVRRAETTVEVGSGQTLAIAGLLDETTRGLSSRLPGVGQIPVLGALFSSVRYQNQQTELVILVTPEIVAPLNPDQSPTLPTDGHVHPNDLELYTMGVLEGGSLGGEHDGCKGASPCRTCQAANKGKLESQPEHDSLHGPFGLANAAGG